MPKITEEKKDEVRMSILHTPRKVFIEKGYEAASMKDIVTSSGRSFGGVYLYFANKEDVFLALLRQEFEQMGLQLETKTQKSAWYVFVYFIGDQERRVREVENGLAACMYEYFIVGRREESRRELIEQRYQAAYGHVLALIQDGVQREEFQLSQPVEPFVHWLISSLDGLYLGCIMNGFDGIEAAKQFELILKISRSILNPIEMVENE